MVRYIAATLAVLALVSTASVPALNAHEGHEHTLMGTVTMATAEHVMLKTTEGSDVTVLVTKDTKITRDKVPMNAHEITAGTRIVVTAVTDKSQTRALTIQVGVAPTTRTP